jgi:hypothetical protein
MGSSIYVFQALREAGNCADHVRISEKCLNTCKSMDRANSEHPEGIAKEQEND